MSGVDDRRGPGLGRGLVGPAVLDTAVTPARRSAPSRCQSVTLSGGSDGNAPYRRDLRGRSADGFDDYQGDPTRCSCRSTACWPSRPSTTSPSWPLRAPRPAGPSPAARDDASGPAINDTGHQPLRDDAVPGGVHRHPAGVAAHRRPGLPQQPLLQLRRALLPVDHDLQPHRRHPAQRPAGRLHGRDLGPQRQQLRGHQGAGATRWCARPSTSSCGSTRRSRNC